MEEHRRWQVAEEHRRAAERLLNDSLYSASVRGDAQMSQIINQADALHISAATAELVARILVEYPQAQIVPRSEPYSDEDISIDVRLPLTMDEVYRVRERIYEHVIELQSKYGVLIQVSAIPQ